MAEHLREVFVVTHSHWDREWYHTAARFRQRLVRLVDELLDDPPHGDASFLLDGQAILIDDYTGVRPERTAELSTLLRDGRLEAGPWYVLADELIPSGEALVRNLLAGRETLARMRGVAPPVLYCPDSFGHPAILPELAAGFGCGVIVLWRGLGGRRSPAADVVRWRGPSGTQVVTYHLPPDGYEFGSTLPAAPSDALKRWNRISEVLAPRAITGMAILLNGADHHAPQRHLAPAIAALNAAAAPIRCRSGSLRSAARAVLSAAQDTELSEIRGELRDSYGYAWTLQGTLGTRAAQKRRNACAEAALIRDVEPWVAMVTNNETSVSLLRAAWRTLLEAHPHDTLCGTSIDAVAEAFESRLGSVEAQYTELRRNAVQALIGHDAELARESSPRWNASVMMRNPAPRARDGIVELQLTATLADITVGPGSAARQGTRRKISPWHVDGIAIQVLARGERVSLTESPRGYPDADLVSTATAVGWTGEVGAYTIASRAQRQGARPTVPNPVVASHTSLQNGRVRVNVDEAGNISLEDMASGRSVVNVVRIERAADIGDLYTPAIRGPIEHPVPTRIRLVHRGPIRGEIAIDCEFPRVRGGQTTSCRIRVQLDADARALRVNVSGDNQQRDQRLRVVFATGLASTTTIADAAFLPVARQALIIAEEDAAMEHVVPTAPLHRWVARFDAYAGAVLVADGLAEYESLGDGGIAVTLVRSVGELSRADLPERPGHAGWPAPTPGAQCIGEFSAVFALQLLGADSPDVRDDIEQLADQILSPLVGETLRSALGDPRTAGGLELRGAGLKFSAAMPAVRRGWITVRCVNLRDKTTRGSWHFSRDVAAAEKTRLDETTLERVDVQGASVAFVANSREIVTLLVLLSS